jgi:transcriptional regulator with XRE-family HTH domain
MNDENLVVKWRKRCIEKGISLNQVCEEVGISRGLLTKWEKREPKTLQIIRAIEKVLE